MSAQDKGEKGPEAHLTEVRGRFPGIDRDERLRLILEDPTTRRLFLFDVMGNLDPIIPDLGGKIDYNIRTEVDQAAADQLRNAGMAVIGPFHRITGVESILPEPRILEDLDAIGHEYPIN